MMDSKTPAQIFIPRSSDSGMIITHGRRQIRPIESPEFDGDADESFTRRKKRALTRDSDDGRDSNMGEMEKIVASFVGQEVQQANIFGVLFPNRSYPLDASNFSQVDSHHWLLDMDIFVGEAYDQVTEMCIYLLNELSIPPHKAVAVYIQSPYSTFQFRGAVYSSCPSAVLSLLWPNSSQMHLTESASPPITAKIGLAIEDLATLPTLNVGHCRKIEEVAMKVGQNLFNFMQSSCSVQGTQLAVPRGLFEQWFKRFEERSKRDSEYLKHVLV
jgi:hypothetical protein